MARRDVFVSYSQPDRDAALELVSSVESHGIECWVAPRDIAPAADWAEEIIDAITAARVMVLVFSASANASPQVRREVERAVHKQVSILPFRIEDVVPSKSLEFFLSSQHWLDAFPPPLEPHYRRLCGHLKSLALPPSVSPSTSSSTAPARAGAEPALAAPDLAHIESVLAGYIGPLAKHLVKLAAVRATGRADLIARLSGELDAESDRSAFAQRCKQLPSA